MGEYGPKKNGGSNQCIVMYKLCTHLADIIHVQYYYDMRGRSQVEDPGRGAWWRSLEEEPGGGAWKRSLVEEPWGGNLSKPRQLRSPTTVYTTQGRARGLYLGEEPN